jgi:Mg-chelatase subunit ChlD
MTTDQETTSDPTQAAERGLTTAPGVAAVSGLVAEPGVVAEQGLVAVSGVVAEQGFAALSGREAEPGPAALSGRKAEPGAAAVPETATMSGAAASGSATMSGVVASETATMSGRATVQGTAAPPRTAPESRTAAEWADPGQERLRRWRLVLGGDAADGTGCALSGQDAAMDGALAALYGKRDKGQTGRDRSAGLGASAPAVARWLGDIRTYFPSSVVQVMQRDAIDRLGLSTLLLEPEMLEAVEADVHLVGTLLSLNKAMPETTKETARAVVRKVVEDLEKRLATRTRATLTGALDRSARISRPRHHDIDWNRTIAANLKHYLPEYRTIVPERLIGYGRASQSVKKEVVLCIDQSGSMAASVVYASVFGAVLASMRSIDTRLVVFDTAVVDLTDQLDDPVDVLFGTQLGGGTDINRALAYCQSQITRPAETVVVLISDLYEGGIRNEMLKRVAAMKASGVQFVTLLALSDEGAPAYDREHAAALAALGAPAFACTPDLFPEVMAAAIEKRPLPIPEGA